ncbi:MAG TPA: hypothetical protein VGD08_02990, partial [Stellaceae bacterium]
YHFGHNLDTTPALGRPACHPLFHIVNPKFRFPEMTGKTGREQEKNRRGNRWITGDSTCFPVEERSSTG